MRYWTIFGALFWCYVSVVCGQTYNIALSNEPSNLNPFFSYDSNSQNINRLVHLSLIDLSRKMEPVCIACESFEQHQTEQGFIIDFQLRKGIHFWDGEEMTAQSVQSAIELYQDEVKVKSLFRKAFGKIKKVIIKDRYHLSLVYEKFDLDNLTDLTLLKILKLKKGRWGKEIEDIIGAGSYKISDIQDMKIVLDKTDQTQKFIFKVVKDETTLALKMLRGEIDISLANLSPRKIEWLKKKTKVRFVEAPSTNLQYLALNNRNELLKEQKFRKVIYNIIPLEKIINYKLKNSVIKATGFFPPGFPQYYEKNSETRSVARAKVLMRAIGAVKNGKFWYYNGKVIKLNWLVVNNKASIELTRIIKDYFERFGILISVQSQEWGSFYKNFKKGKFDILMSRWIGFTGPSILRFALHTKSFAPTGGNRVYFSNLEFDHLLDLGLAEVDQEKRTQNIKKALHILDREKPYIYLWYPKIIWAMQEDIRVDELYPNTNFKPLEGVRSVSKNAK